MNCKFSATQFASSAAQRCSLRSIAPVTRRRAAAVRCSASQSEVANHQSQAPANGAPATGLASKYNWTFDNKEDKSSGAASNGRQILELPVAAIRRPLGRTRGNDQDKVAALMESITAIGLQEPIDVLEVDGVYYGFSGCHRYEAHQRLGLETIRCRVRKANKEVLKMHMM
ncbi:hypothetical protein CHLRE_17g729950v5 [Chlamydomonas reinhardtii]|uniref:sulfiredoxin n=1 Tax=Chlamydomonas reinhardtii TaxID=3055 RepID=A0A2K3CQW5_CHLRE|nr:uncharacterized protein CHLRE_17g729950v5 [Chlamydomonas reinhardtii]PNW70677.1 hypothetical protein CHLRE_17g729950v5 [Chlamydomonas reinhardtii]